MSQRTQKVIFAITILLNASISHANEVADCMATQNNTERLACYDAIFGNPENPASVAAPSPTLPETSGASDTLLANNDATNTFGKEPPHSAEQKPDEALELKELVSTIARFNRRSRNELVIYLANEQIWQQTSPRYLNAKVGDNIVIRRGRMGDYIMTTERSESTRVKRLR